MEEQRKINRVAHGGKRLIMQGTESGRGRGKWRRASLSVRPTKRNPINLATPDYRVIAIRARNRIENRCGRYIEWWWWWWRWRLPLFFFSRFFFLICNWAVFYVGFFFVFLFVFFNQVYTCRSREAETCGRVIGDAESGAGEKRKNPGAETDYRLTHVQIMETSLLQFQFSLLALNLIYLKAVSQSRPYKVISQSLENPLAAGKSASAPPLAPPPPPLGSVTADTS